MSANIERGVAESLEDQGLEPRVCVHCGPATGRYTPGRVLAPEEGGGFVLSAVQKLREVREALGKCPPETAS